MSKAEMIQAIIQKAVQTAQLQNKWVDTTDMFFTLAFRTDRELKKLCKDLRIA